MMSLLGRTGLFHLYQILTIYAPGAALIPVVLVASFYSAVHAGIAAAALLGLIALGFVLRPRVAERLGLDRDYE